MTLQPNGEGNPENGTDPIQDDTVISFIKTSL